MPLKPCRECKTEVSTQAKTCPKCGVSNPVAPNKLVIFAALFGLFVVCVAVSSGDKKQGGTVAATAAVQAPAAREFVKESCSELAGMFDAGSSMTELQQKDAWRAYDDKWVKWVGTVTEVGETFGTLQLHLKCRAGTLTSDVIVSFPDNARAQLIALKPGTKVQFSAQLTGYSRFIGLSARKGELVAVGK